MLGACMSYVLAHRGATTARQRGVCMQNVLCGIRTYTIRTPRRNKNTHTMRTLRVNNSVWDIGPGGYHGHLLVPEPEGQEPKEAEVPEEGGNGRRGLRTNFYDT